MFEGLELTKGIDNIFQYKNIPILAAATILMIFLIVSFYLFVKWLKRKTIEEEFNERLIEATSTKVYEQEEMKPSLMDKFNNTAYKTIKILMKDYHIESPDRAGVFAVAFFAVLYVVGFIFTRNVGIPLFIGVAGLVIPIKLAEKKIKEKERLFEDQIPSFLAALKSNVQANQTPERALIEAINTTDYPLYEELKIAKSLTETGSFHMALNALRNQTDNNSLKFLCSCIELSSQVGANLEEQIEIIEEMLDNKQELNRKLERAVAENTPLIYVSSLVIPGMFTYLYATTDMARNFWFTTLESYAIFLAAIGIFGSGLWLSNREIKKVTEMAGKK